MYTVQYNYIFYIYTIITYKFLFYLANLVGYRAPQQVKELAKKNLQYVYLIFCKKYFDSKN